MKVDTPPDLIGDYLARRGRRGGGQMTKQYADRLAEGQGDPTPARMKSRAGVPRHRHDNSDRYLPVTPFRTWLIEMRDAHGIQWLVEIVQAATTCTDAVARRKIHRWLNETDSVDIDIVDRVTLYVAGPDLLRELYPLDRSEAAA